jgi:signal transduction histidine kinase
MQNAQNCDTTETSLADLGELAGPLTHDVNTLLQNLMLRLALLNSGKGNANNEELKYLRDQANHLAGIVKSFQRRRRRDGSEPTAVDLNAALLEAALFLQNHGEVYGTPRFSLVDAPSEFSPGALVLQRQPNLPPTMAFEGDVVRLCRFLLSNALRAAGQDGPAVLARTAQSGSGVKLWIEDAGPDVPAADLPRIFDSGPDARQGMSCLELAACRSIVRRLQGKMTAEQRPGGGLIITAMLCGMQK